MTADRRARDPVPVELILAGCVMIFIVALPVALSALIEFEATPSSFGLLTVALVLATPGVEAIRRRHFWYAFLMPVVLALMNLAYATQVGYVALPGAIILGLVAWLVYSHRSDFR